MKNLPIKEQLLTTMSIELFNRDIDSLEERIKSQGFRYDVKYHSDAVNNAMQKDFEAMVNALQSFIDEYFWQYYQVDVFQRFSLKDFDFCVRHNLGIINSFRKLLKFADC